MGMGKTFLKMEYLLNCTITIPIYNVVTFVIFKSPSSSPLVTTHESEFEFTKI